MKAIIAGSYIFNSTDWLSQQAPEHAYEKLFQYYKTESAGI